MLGSQRRRVTNKTLAALFRLPTARDYLEFIESPWSWAFIEYLEPAKRDGTWMEMEERLRSFEADQKRNVLTIDADIGGDDFAFNGSAQKCGTRLKVTEPDSN
jgi:hypothetical protein